MPRVRVVVPTHNHATFLADALASAMTQTLEDLEIVVVDDGSTDDTESIVKGLARRDTRLRFIRQENQGVAAARNRAIEEPGQFDYVAFLDSDDLWHPDHLSRSVKFLDMKSEAVLVFGRRQVVDQDGRFTVEGGIQRHESALDRLRASSRKLDIADAYLVTPEVCRRMIFLGAFSPWTSSVVVRRSAVRRGRWFEESLKVLEDVDFYVHLMGNPFGFLDSIQGSYVRHNTNLTAARDLASPRTLELQLSVLAFNKRRLAMCVNDEERQQVHAQIADTAYLVGQCQAEQGNSDMARSAYFEAFRHRPGVRALRSIVGAALPGWLKSRLRRTVVG